MNCKEIIRMKGAGSKYAKDCQIRLIQGRPYAEAAALIGWTDPPPIIIHAGIGTLVLGDTEEFTPAPTVGKMAKSWISSLADRASATEDQIAARTATCATCPLNANGSCSACGCGLAAKIRLKSQTCPKGMW